MATPRKAREDLVYDNQLRIDEFGLDRILDLIEEGMFLSDVAREIGVDRRRLYHWIEADADRKAAVEAARLESGHADARRAEHVLKALRADSTPSEVARARELAQQYRWAAKMRNRKVYGDQQVVEHVDTVAEMSDEAIRSQLEQLLEKAKAAGALPLH